MKIINKNMINAFMIYIITLLLYSNAAQAGSIVTNEPVRKIHEQVKNVEYKGTYQNAEFLYSFQIPGDLICTGGAAPAPNHGCRIYLSETRESYLWINADYNVSDGLSPADSFLRGLDSLVKDGMEITVLRRAKFSLAGLEAERFAVNYRKKNVQGKSESTVRDMAIAFRSIKGCENIIYTIGLTTTESLYKKNKIALDNVLKSWNVHNKQDK